MNILFLTTHAYFPQRSGGSESSTHNLCRLLQKKGHKVAVISSLDKFDWVWLKNRIKSKILKQAAPKDKLSSYNVYRTWDFNNGLKEVIENFKPDCVITQAGENIPLIKKLCDLKIQTFVYLRDVSFEFHGGEYFAHPYLKYISNSQFTASKFFEKYSLTSKIIPPIIPPEEYKTKVTPQSVLFVCPNKAKGVDIAIMLAKLNPDIPFVFLESWALNEERLNYLTEHIKDLKNVKFLRAQKDMATIYSKTKIAIIPSQCEEAWGRIATEAQINGIPVIANNIGGLSESVGSGGVLVSHANFDINEWNKALRHLWDDDDIFLKYQTLSLEHSKRLEITPEYLINKLEKYIS